MKTYHAAVETGVCSPDESCWEDRINCGHNHRSLETALRCLAYNRLWYCNHGRRAGEPCPRCGIARRDRCNPVWNCTAYIHDNEHHRVCLAD